MKKTVFLAVLLLIALGSTQAAMAKGPALPHFELSKSEPGAEATVQSPPEVRLWFTQVPQENTISIRVLDTNGDPLHTGEVTQDASDGQAFSVALHGTLPPASYTVSWRAMGTDGHVVRGDFIFIVSGS
jgi:methionine-rich copper-binding protein CopC